MNLSIYRTGTARNAGPEGGDPDSLSIQLNSYGTLGFQAYNDTTFFTQKLAAR